MFPNIMQPNQYSNHHDNNSQQQQQNSQNSLGFTLFNNNSSNPIRDAGDVGQYEGNNHHLSQHDNYQQSSNNINHNFFDNSLPFYAQAVAGKSNNNDELNLIKNCIKKPNTYQEFIQGGSGNSGNRSHQHHHQHHYQNQPQPQPPSQSPLSSSSYYGSRGYSNLDPSAAIFRRKVGKVIKKSSSNEDNYDDSYQQLEQFNDDQQYECKYPNPNPKTFISNLKSKNKQAKRLFKKEQHSATLEMFDSYHGQRPISSTIQINSLQNLKMIAKTVYDIIKQSKVISYKQISDKLFIIFMQSEKLEAQAVKRVKMAGTSKQLKSSSSLNKHQPRSQSQLQSAQPDNDSNHSFSSIDENQFVHLRSSTYQRDRIINEMIESKSFKNINKLNDLKVEHQQQQQGKRNNRKLEDSLAGGIKQEYQRDDEQSHPQQKDEATQQKAASATPQQPLPQITPAQQNNIKNIRRRLYDAINVMMASNIVVKNKNGLLSLGGRNRLDQAISTLKSIKRARRQPIISVAPANVKTQQHSGKKDDSQGEEEQAKLMMAKDNNQQQYMEKPLTISTTPLTSSFQQLQDQIHTKQLKIDGMKRHRDSTISKYLALKKHINMNRINDANPRQQQQQPRPQQQRSALAGHQNMLRIPFPIILANMTKPAQISITNNQTQSSVVIESNEKASLHCDVDILGCLYWVQKDQIKQQADRLNDKLTKKLSTKL